MLLRGFAGRNGLVWILIFEFAKGEAASFGNPHGASDRFGQAGKEPRHFPRRLEMPFGIACKPESCIRDRALLADAGEDVGQGPALRDVIVYVIDGNERCADALAEFVE